MKTSNKCMKLINLFCSGLMKLAFEKGNDNVIESLLNYFSKLIINND